MKNLFGLSETENLEFERNVWNITINNIPLTMKISEVYAWRFVVAFIDGVNFKSKINETINDSLAIEYREKIFYPNFMKMEEIMLTKDVIPIQNYGKGTFTGWEEALESIKNEDGEC